MCMCLVKDKLFNEFKKFQKLHNFFFGGGGPGGLEGGLILRLGQ
jgi:hypothetical protein